MSRKIQYNMIMDRSVETVNQLYEKYDNNREIIRSRMIIGMKHPKGSFLYEIKTYDHERGMWRCAVSAADPTTWTRAGQSVEFEVTPKDLRAEIAIARESRLVFSEGFGDQMGVA